MSLTFRRGGDADVPAVAGLLSHSFPGIGRSLADWEAWLRQSPLGGVETLLVGEEAGSPIAACRLYDYEQWVGGRPIRTMGLGAVTISATARRRGLAARMCAAAFEAAREDGAVASALYPFRVSFYQKLGYGLAGEAHQHVIRPADLPDHPGRARVSLVEGEGDREKVASIYAAWLPTQTGQMARPGRAWELVWQDGTRHGAIYEDERGPSGYAVFRYLAGGPRGTRAIDVEEIVWLHREARLGLYGWLSSLADQWDLVHYRAHPEEGFPEHLRDFRPPAEPHLRWHFWFPSASVLRGPMFRLLDLERAWSARTIRTGPPLTLALEVQDEPLPANAGAWTLRLENGRIEASRGLAAEPDLRMEIGIADLSRLYVGSLAPSTAVAAGRAAADVTGRLDDLDALLRVPRPWTFDRF